jgi:hypothetical protein
VYCGVDRKGESKLEIDPKNLYTVSERELI